MKTIEIILIGGGMVLLLDVIAVGIYFISKHTSYSPQKLDGKSVRLAQTTWKLFIDAYHGNGGGRPGCCNDDFLSVTRKDPTPNNIWIMQHLRDNVFAFQLKSYPGYYLNANDVGQCCNTCNIVPSYKNGNSQWELIPQKGTGNFIIKNVGTGQFLDADGTSGTINDNYVVTIPAAGPNSIWHITVED